MIRTKIEIDVSRLNTQRRKSKATLCAMEIETVINSELFKNNFLELLRKRNYQAKIRNIIHDFTKEEWKQKLAKTHGICPECKTFYCIKCSDALVNMENACWVCNTPFNEYKPSKPFEIIETDVGVDIKDN